MLTTFRVKRRVHDLWYRLKCFLWYRYTTVKPRTLKFHTWTDRDNLLLHCSFEILCRFLEEECSPGIVDWDCDEEDKQAMKTMKELYVWWNKYIENEHKNLKWSEESKEIKEKLHKLIDVMDYMWT